MFGNTSIIPLSPEVMNQVHGGDRVRQVEFIDTDGDGDPDLKRVTVLVDGKVKKRKTKVI